MFVHRPHLCLRSILHLSSLELIAKTFDMRACHFEIANELLYLLFSRMELLGKWQRRCQFVRQRDRLTEKELQKELRRDRRAERQKDIYTDKQKELQKHRQTDGRTNTKIDRQHTQADGMAERQADGKTIANLSGHICFGTMVSLVFAFDHYDKLLCPQLAPICMANGITLLSESNDNFEIVS